MSLSLESHFKSNLIISFSSGERLNVVPDYAQAVITQDLTKEFDDF